MVSINDTVDLPFNHFIFFVDSYFYIIIFFNALAKAFLFFPESYHFWLSSI